MQRFAAIFCASAAVALAALSLQAEEKTPAAAPAAATAKAEEAPAKDYVILELNGDKIQYSEVEKIWDDLFPGDGKAPPLAGFGDAVRDNIVRGIASERLMLQEAERAKLGESPEVQARLEQLRKQLMVQQLLKERHADLSDSNVKKRYDELIGKMSGKEEVHASHILVSSKEEAEKLRKAVKDGADFATLAKEKSSDKGSAVRGGDLGFFTQDQMVPEFAKAAFALKKGEISQPVQSPFGWHIIKLTDRRPLPVPTLEEARPQIEKQLETESDQAYILDLLKDADIKYFDTDGKELEFPLEQQEMPGAK